MIVADFRVCKKQSTVFPEIPKKQVYAGNVYLPEQLCALTGTTMCIYPTESHHLMPLEFNARE